MYFIILHYAILFLYCELNYIIFSNLISLCYLREFYAISLSNTSFLTSIEDIMIKFTFSNTKFFLFLGFLSTEQSKFMHFEYFFVGRDRELI